jgi:Tfp pilus assembly protein PilO
MKAADRTILAGLAIAGLIAAFWFVVLAPKRDEAATLADEVAALQDSVAAQEQLVAEGQQAQDDFNRNYQRLVVLGKAVPEDEDTSSLFVQLQDIAKRAGVEFDAIELVPGGGTGGATPAPAEQTTTDQSASSGSEPAPATEAAPAAATEAAASNLPIGATVGPAGLPLLPYNLTFQGSFFDVADFMSGVDSLVRLRDGSSQVAADGRLLTVDGFSLKPIPTLGGEQQLAALFAVTSYVVPSDEGLTAGATPGGPSVSPLQTPTTPTSTTSPTVTP